MFAVLTIYFRFSVAEGINDQIMGASGEKRRCLEGVRDFMNRAYNASIKTTDSNVVVRKLSVTSTEALVSRFRYFLCFFVVDKFGAIKKVKEIKVLRNDLLTNSYLYLSLSDKPCHSWLFRTIW